MTPSVPPADQDARWIYSSADKSGSLKSSSASNYQQHRSSTDDHEQHDELAGLDAAENASATMNDNVRGKEDGDGCLSTYGQSTVLPSAAGSTRLDEAGTEHGEGDPLNTQNVVERDPYWKKAVKLLGQQGQCDAAPLTRNRVNLTTDTLGGIRRRHDHYLHKNMDNLFLHKNIGNSATGSSGYQRRPKTVRASSSHPSIMQTSKMHTATSNSNSDSAGIWGREHSFSPWALSRRNSPSNSETDFGMVVAGARMGKVGGEGEAGFGGSPTPSARSPWCRQVSSPPWSFDLDNGAMQWGGGRRYGEGRGVEPSLNGMQ